MAERQPAAHEPAVDGLVVIDKPAGWTSHDVVARCRKVFKQRKVGHAGTLDPDATGVLVVGLGRATRLLRFLVGLPKSYTGEVVLGVATSTQDAAGEVTGRWDMRGVSLDQAREAAGTLTGRIEQIPPMVSAVQVGGRRLHELARAGVEVERDARAVTVSRFDIALAGTGKAPTGPGGPVLAVEVDCSSGTYVRTLAADLGTALGGGAHLRNLRRIAVGPWTISDAVVLDEVSPERVLPPAAAVSGLAAVTAAAGLEGAIGHGRVLAAADLGADGPGPWAVLGQGGELLAVYEVHGAGQVKPVLVLGPGSPSTTAEPAPSRPGPVSAPPAAG